MTKEDRQKIYAALAAPFPEEAIERTDGKVTGRGYSTTGIKYQYIVDRLAEVLGVGGFRTERTIHVKEIATAKGRPAYEAICELRLQLGEWVDGTFQPFAEALGDGGHIAMSEADARKGAFTNAFKKTAAFFGPGRDAYRGTLDDDNVPAAETGVASTRPSTPPQPTRTTLSPAPTPPANPSSPERSRLSAKQHAMIRGLAREHGYADGELLDMSRRRFGVAIDFLTRRQASDLIGALSGNGHDRQPGEEG